MNVFMTESLNNLLNQFVEKQWIIQDSLESTTVFSSVSEELLDLLEAETETDKLTGNFVSKYKFPCYSTTCLTFSKKLKSAINRQ